MLEDINEIFIREKEKYQKSLIQQYQAACAQRLATRDDSDKVVLNEKIAQLEQDIQATQAKLNELKAAQQTSSSHLRQKTVNWEDQIHAINYNKAKKTIETVFKGLKQREGSALFLMRKSRSMGGKWCAQKVKHQIRQELGSMLMPCEVGFSHHQTVGAVEFLRDLAQRYSVDAQSEIVDVRSFSEKVIGCIIDSLVSGNILLMEIDICALSPQDTFLVWFVNGFWGPLNIRLRAVASQKQRIRLIALLSVQGTIPRTCLPVEICCKKTSFNGGKILELPLQKWTEQEICNWLFDHSGLTRQAVPLPNEGITRMAKSIHSVTNGLPRDVYHELMEEMKNCAC